MNDNRSNQHSGRSHHDRNRPPFTNRTDGFQSRRNEERPRGFLFHQQQQQQQQHYHQTFQPPPRHQPPNYTQRPYYGAPSYQPPPHHPNQQQQQQYNMGNPPSFDQHNSMNFPVRNSNFPSPNRFAGASAVGNFPSRPPPFFTNTPRNFNNFHLPIQASFTPPIPSPSDLSVNTPADDPKAELKEAMKDVVDKWMKTRNLNPDSNGENKINDNLLKIHEYKELMRELMLKVEELRQLNDLLAESMESSTDTWIALTAKVKECKNEVMELQGKLMSEPQVDHISHLLKKRKQKRVRLRNRKKRAAEDHVKALSRRIKQNEKIDEWQHRENAKIHMEKMIESLKNEAGESLTEVKRKQTEANELIEVFQLLKELRDIRKDTAIYKGVFVTEQDNENFNKKVDEATDLLRSQKRLYEDEEKALRVLREEEAEDFERIEVEKRKKRKKRGEDDLSSVDPMSMFRMYWLQAEDNVAGLIHVRSMWDMFLSLPLTPGASRMPDNWPEPSKPSSKEWERYLVKPPVQKRKTQLNDSVMSF